MLKNYFNSMRETSYEYKRVDVATGAVTNVCWYSPNEAADINHALSIKGSDYRWLPR